MWNCGEFLFGYGSVTLGMWRREVVRSFTCVDDDNCDDRDGSDNNRADDADI